MKEFERWYGCDESNRDEFTQQVESLIGTHVRVGDEVLGYEVGSKDISILTVPPGTYVLRSSQGCVDIRGGKGRANRHREGRRGHNRPASV